MAEQPDDVDFESVSSQFVDWMQQNGNIISSKIKIADLRSRHAGRGVLATQDLSQDDELFRIPRTSILTVETSSLPHEITVSSDNPWLSLIVAMIFENQQGAESKWKPYFDIIPTHFDTLMYWSNEELRYLEGSAVVDKIGRESADEAFTQQIVPVIREHVDLFHASALTDEDLLALCHLMGSTIMAYAFDLENASGNAANEQDGWEEDSDAGESLPKGMIPLADMLNADADRNNAKLFYEDGYVVMKAIKPIKSGDEIFNDYGPLPTADVLRRYGYVTENYAKYDVVEISLQSITEAARGVMEVQQAQIDDRLAYLEDQDALDDGYDISRRSSEEEQFSEELRVLLNAVVMSQEDFDKLRKKEKLPKPDLSRDALHVLYETLVRRRSMYPGADTRAVANGGNAGRPDCRQLMAQVVILGEKIVLTEAATAVQEMLANGSEKRKVETFEEDAIKMNATNKRLKEERIN